MPIMIIGEIPGLNEKGYQRIAETFEAKLRDAPGFIFHAGGPAMGGWKIVEVWESFSAFNDWLEGAASDYMPKDYEPLVQVHEVFTVLK